MTPVGAVGAGVVVPGPCCERSQLIRASELAPAPSQPSVSLTAQVSDDSSHPPAPASPTDAQYAEQVPCLDSQLWTSTLQSLQTRSGSTSCQAVLSHSSSGSGTTVASEHGASPARSQPVVGVSQYQGSSDASYRKPSHLHRARGAAGQRPPLLSRRAAEEGQGGGVASRADFARVVGQAVWIPLWEVAARMVVAHPPPNQNPIILAAQRVCAKGFATAYVRCLWPDCRGVVSDSALLRAC